MSDFFTARVEGYVWTGKEGTIYTCIDGSDIGWGIHALTVAQKESNAIYIKNYLTEKGWSLEAICALLGNMEHESGINPALWQHFNQTGNGHGYGLVQWTPNKYVPERYLEWMGLNATMANELAQKDPKKLMDTQLEYLLIELEPSAGQWGDFRNKLPEIKNMPIEEFIHNSKNYSAYTLAKVFQAYYERTESFQKKRSDDADKWFRFFTNSY